MSPHHALTVNEKLSHLRLIGLAVPNIQPVDLAIDPGECVCISGRSGVGKTQLLRAIADLDSHKGEVLLDDIACSSVRGSAWRRRVGLLPAESRWWRDRVGEHFERVDREQLRALGFQRDVLDHAVAHLSTGERQRLALLRLLCQRPAVLLLDEPTASLDAKSVRRVEQLIATYRQEHRAPVLWVTHDPEQIKRVCRRHYSLNDGVLNREDRT